MISLQTISKPNEVITKYFVLEYYLATCMSDSPLISCTLLLVLGSSFQPFSFAALTGGFSDDLSVAACAVARGQRSPFRSQIRCEKQFQHFTYDAITSNYWIDLEQNSDNTPVPILRSPFS